MARSGGFLSQSSGSLRAATRKTGPMAIRVAPHHKTAYRYDRLVSLSPQAVRWRPAPHSRTPISSDSLRVEPAEYFLLAWGGGLGCG
ncbi:MAG: transglutaminase N-terminal domain-containing protein [Bryobacteraceae bacterium]